MLSIQAVCGLPRLHAPGIVPCIISFSRLEEVEDGAGNADTAKYIYRRHAKMGVSGSGTHGEVRIVVSDRIVQEKIQT